MTDNLTLADALLREQERCRELLQAYKDIGPVGTFAHTMLSAALKRADIAAASGDVVGMLRSLEELRGCQ